jgi:hypothetical protein
LLNEFLVLERALVAAGFSVLPRHPDVQSPGKSAALHVRLDANGTPVESMLLPGDAVAKLWTLRDGKHNSFPYVQLKQPLLSVPRDREWHSTWSEKWKQLSSIGDRRRELCALAKSFPVADTDWNTWPGPGLKHSLVERSAVLLTAGNETRAVTSLIKRFLTAVAEPATFIRKLERRLLDDLTEGDTELLELVGVALAGKVKVRELVGVPLYLDVARYEFANDVAGQAEAARVGAALTAGVTTHNHGKCNLTGAECRLHIGNFPQPSVPVLGQFYLFAMNGDIPAAHRYGLADDTAIRVDALLVQRMAGALDAITAKHLKGKTWRSVPSEKPKKNDLFLTFVDGGLEARVADMIAGADEGEDEEETADENTSALERSAFMMRTKRVVDAIRAKVDTDFRKTPVTYCILRKVDKGNAKAILYRVSTVGKLYDAAIDWAKAEDNVPHWLTLPVPTKSRTVKDGRAPHIAPLQIPRLTRMLFIRGGDERAKKEPLGVAAQDAFSLFLDEGTASEIAHRALGLVLQRQGELLSGAAEAQRKDAGKAKLNDTLKFDWVAALGAVTLLGLLLCKLGRQKEVYMNDTAFKLGQLLAVADIVHIGYCMDMRGGDVPPTLLGNSVLTTAQSDPVKALAVLCRRWKPYAAWAKRPSVWTEADQMKDSQDQSQKRRGWAMLAALSQARRADDLAQELHERLPSCANDLAPGQLPLRAGDAFRAELLLGYVAGLPQKEKPTT